MNKPYIMVKNNETNEKFSGKVACLKSKKLLQKKNANEDWALGCHPRDQWSPTIV